MFCSPVVFKNPNQLLPGSVQGDGFSGFRKICPSLAAPASPGGSSSHSAPSQREGPAPAEDLQAESIFWKQEPLSFQNHRSLTLFRPQLKEEMVFQTKSYSTHSSNRHLLQLSVSERPCSVCCGTLRVFHIPFSLELLQYSWSRATVKVTLLPHACQGFRLLHGTDNKTDYICIAVSFSWVFNILYLLEAETLLKVYISD